MSLLALLRRRRRSRAATRTPRGFTMVEVLTVVVVVSTLARIGVPGFHEVLLKARATEVIGDFETVRVAAFGYHADHLRWPADGYTGEVPRGLETYLPENFSFQRLGYRLDWESWEVPDGLPGAPGAKTIVGISVVTEDRELGRALADVLGGAMAHYELGDTYTFVIESN